MRRPKPDPGVTDLRRYRRERERARRAAPKRPKGEPVLGGRRNAGLILIVVIAILAALGLLSGRHF